MLDDEPFGYDHDGDGWLDGEDRGSLWNYDFDGDGDKETGIKRPVW